MLYPLYVWNALIVLECTHSTESTVDEYVSFVDKIVHATLKI